ncbi:MAG TPA: DUF1080 domain-containing protein, partial [Candidatus Hydrogenedentes bacterium]|nr:DUF1080 domain-containing protein [Candidatus Hydrogenedentota bacterium]
IELKRRSNLDKPTGQWHQGRFECVGNALRVYLNGELLYEAQDATLDAGRIGFYASQGLVHVKDIVVSGKPSEAKGEFVMPDPMFVHVCTDAGAGAYEAFPDVCRLSDGRLMSVFYAGYGHVALPNERLPRGGRIAYCLSSDEGRTWTDAEILYDGPMTTATRRSPRPAVAASSATSSRCGRRRAKNGHGPASAHGWSTRTTWAKPGPSRNASPRTTTAAHRCARSRTDASSSASTPSARGNRGAR